MFVFWNTSIRKYMVDYTAEGPTGSHVIVDYRLSRARVFPTLDEVKSIKTADGWQVHRVTKEDIFLAKLRER